MDLTSICDALLETDVRKKGAALSDLTLLLRDGEVDMENIDVGTLVDGISKSLNDNNFKISQSALTCAAHIVPALGEGANSHISVLFPEVLKRLGDNKQTVREAALDTALGFVDVLGPESASERLLVLLDDKSPKLRESALHLFCLSLQGQSPARFPLRTLANKAVKLTTDPQEKVREESILLLESLYRCTGAELRELLLAADLRPTTLSTVLTRLQGIAIDEDGVYPLIDAATAAAQASKAKVQSRKAAARPASGLSSLSSRVDPSTLDVVAPAPAIPVYSARDLAKECTTLMETLKDTTTCEWEERVAALRQFQSFVRGGAMEFDNFHEIMMAMKSPIAEQVLDLRSKVLKEACALLVFLAEVLHQRFESYVEYYIPVLFKLLPASKSAISEPANKAIRALLTIVSCPRALVEILAAATGKNSMLRPYCMEYVLLVMEKYETDLLTRYCDGLEAAVRSGINDALGDVRKSARQAFWAFSRHFAERGRRMLASFDTSTQQRLYEEHEKKPAANNENTHVNANVRAPSGAVKKEPAAHNESGAKSVPRGVLTESTARAMREPARETQPPAPLRDTTSRAQTAAPTARRSSLSRPVDEEEHVVPLRGEVGRAPAETTASTATRKPKRMSVMGPLRVPAGVLVDSSAAATVSAPPPPLLGPKRVPQAPTETEVPLHLSKPRRTERPVSAPMMHGAPAAVAVASDAGAPVPVAGRTRRLSVAERETEETPSATAQTTEDLAAILAKANSTVWSARVECFEGICNLLSSERRSEIRGSAFPRIVDLHLKHIGDQHYKVVVAALDSLRMLVETAPAQTDNMLDQMLPEILRRTADPKKVVTDRVTGIFKTLHARYGADAIVPALMKIIVTAPARTKLLSLAALRNEIGTSGDHFNHPVRMRQYTDKLLTIGGDKALDLKRAAVDALVDLHDAFPELFCSQVHMLTSSAQMAARRLLAPRIAQFEKELDSVAAPTDAGDADAGLERSLPTAPAPAPATATPASRRVSLSAAEAVPTTNHLLQRRKELIETPLVDQPNPNAMAFYRNDSLTFHREQTPVHDGQPLHHASHVSAPRSALKTSLPRDEQADTLGFAEAQRVEAPRRVEPRSIPLPLEQSAPMAPTHRVESAASSQRAHVSAAPTAPRWSHRVPELINAAASAHSVASSLGELTAFAKSCTDGHLWDEFFGQILLAATEALGHEDGYVRKEAAVLLTEMVSNQCQRFLPYINVVLGKLLLAYGDAAADVSRHATGALEALLDGLAPAVVIDVLRPSLAEQDGPALALCIRHLTRVVAKMAPGALNDVARILMPSLVEAFRNSNADVRKAVVFLLVELYVILGDDFVPYLSELTTSQVKLVTIYINRRKGVKTAD